MTASAKKLISSTEAKHLLPGTGQAMLKNFLRARWLTPVRAGKKPLFRAADVEACIDRLENGEIPKAVHRWRTALGQDSAHLVDLSGKPACGCREREWLDSAASVRQCTRCMGAAKTLNVVEK